MKMNFTDRVRRVLGLAREEAIRLQHDSLRAEHILLGLLGERDGMATAVLTNLAVDLDPLRARVEASMQRGKAAVTRGELPYTTSARKVLDSAMAEARELKHPSAGTEHLLLGLLRDPDGFAAGVLGPLGVTIDTARRETRNLLGYPPERTPSRSIDPGSGRRSEADHRSGRSLLEQIMAPVIEGIADGVLRPGQPLPTVDELADRLDAPTAVVAHAYADLEANGFITTDAEGGARVGRDAASGGIP